MTVEITARRCSVSTRTKCSANFGYSSSQIKEMHAAKAV